MKGATVLTPSTQPQSEPLYAEATVQVNDNVEIIEMKPKQMLYMENVSNKINRIHNHK